MHVSEKSPRQPECCKALEKEFHVAAGRVGHSKADPKDLSRCCNHLRRPHLVQVYAMEVIERRGGRNATPIAGSAIYLTGSETNQRRLSRGQSRLSRADERLDVPCPFV